MDTISLKFLRVIDSLINNKSITKTAEALDTSVSSINYTLKELRRITGKNLFYRSGKGMTPDADALQLQTRYKDILPHIYQQDSGDSSLKKKDIFISTYSLIELYLGMVTFPSESNRDDACLRFVPLGLTEEERLQKLRNREIDIDIGLELPGDNAIASVLYFESELEVFVSKNHPRITTELTLKDWDANSHCKWSNGNAFMNDAFHNADLLGDFLQKRTVSYESSNLMNLVLFCANSQNLMVMPSVFKHVLLKEFPLNSFPLPVENKYTFKCYAHYHRTMYNEDDILSYLADWSILAESNPA